MKFQTKYICKFWDSWSGPQFLLALYYFISISRAPLSFSPSPLFFSPENNPYQLSFHFLQALLSSSPLHRISHFFLLKNKNFGRKMPVSSSRSRWKFSFGRTSSSSPSSSAPPSPSPSIPSPSSAVPMSFICPISSSLMFDPVIVPTGHTFERACIEACVQFGFAPPPLSSSHLSPSSPSFLLIPNAALRAAIADFCDRASMPRPSPLSPQSARALVRNLIDSDAQFKKRGGEEAAAAAAAIDSTSKTLNEKYPSQFSPSSSASFSSSSASSFSSSEMVTASTPSSSSSSQDESKTPKSSSEVSEETSVLAKLKSPQLSIKESGLRALRQSTRESSELRVSLCTPKLLQALVPMIVSKNPSTQTNSTAIIVNLSIEPSNKVKIVRSGAVPPLVETLKFSSIAEARDNAAGALFSLALDDENKLAIGVLGAIPPLINMFVSGHIEAGMALYHLSLAPNNLVKITKMPGAVKAMLNVATGTRGGDSERIGLMILASLARRNEGKAALMDAGAVKSMAAMMKQGVSGKEEEYCLATMYEMSKGSLRFRALAKAAGAERALMEMLEGEGGEIAKEMARRILKVVRGDEEKGFVLLLGDEEDDEDEDGEKEVRSVVSDGLVSFRRKCDDFGSSSASNSADF